jgi:FixJ family two-component response regulator
MKKGAFDFISKPAQRDALILTIERALNHKIFLDKYCMLKHENDHYHQRIEQLLSDLSSDHPNITEQLDAVREALLNLKDSVAAQDTRPA